MDQRSAFEIMISEKQNDENNSTQDDKTLIMILSDSQD